MEILEQPQNNNNKRSNWEVTASAIPCNIAAQSEYSLAWFTCKNQFEIGRFANRSLIKQKTAATFRRNPLEVSLPIEILLRFG